MSETVLDSHGAATGDYFEESRRPLASLMFCLPLLALYELGVALQGQQAILNGADVWLRQLLSAAGVVSSLALPALVVAILLAWHHTTGRPWRVSGGVLGGMCVECTALAVVLLCGAQLQGRLFERWDAPANLLAATSPSTLGRLVSYFGAGVYEETLFRLVLLPAAVLLLRGAGVKNRTATIAAIVLTSALFAAAHHVGASGEEWDLYRASFRFAAGAMFSVLFLYRGFGIAVGTHALYDVFAGLW